MIPSDPAGLQAFHRRHKYELLARDPQAYRRLGRLAAAADAVGYAAAFGAAIATPPTPARHVNVLQHLAGMLPPPGRGALLAAAESYRRGDAALEHALAVARAWAPPGGWIAQQTYIGRAASR